MNRALRICRRVGCTALVAFGFCDKHSKIETEKRFEALNDKKTPEDRKFYSSARWTECSRLHRIKEPLCRRCKQNEKTVPAVLVHHNPGKNDLIAAGLSPFDDKFLESLCFRCHQKELRKHGTI